MISVHWIPDHRGPEDGARFAHWQPPFVKLICIDKKPPYTGDLPPAAQILVRNHPMSEMGDQRGFADAGAAGRVGTEHALICREMTAYLATQGVPASRLLFEGLNEPQLWAAEPPALVAVYYKSFLAGLHGYGLHGVVGNFGVGWPGNGGVTDAPPQWSFFNPVFAIMQAGDYLGLHEYWSLNGPQENWRWWAGRFLQCPAKVPILITECGIDTGVSGTPQGGWRDLPESTYDAKAERYVNEIYWYAHQCQKDARVRGIFPFTYDMSGPYWQKFNIRDQVWIEQFFKKLDAEGMPQPGGVVLPPPVDPVDPPPVDPPPPVVVYTIAAHTMGSEPNAGVSYAYGYCRMLHADGTFRKFMSGESKRVHLRAAGSPSDAIEPVIVGPHPGYETWGAGYYSISPLQPHQQWEIALEDTVRGWSPWYAWATNDNQTQIDFVWTPATTPQPPVDPLIPEQALRNAAWQRMGIPYNPDAAFSKYARAHNLGNPVEPETIYKDWTLQGFAGGILYCRTGDWGNIKVLPW
jgi:hypothetical protein